MSYPKYVQIISTKDKRTQSAVSEYVALGQLDRTVKTKEDREAWENLWQEFVHSDKWTLAITFITKYGI